MGIRGPAEGAFRAMALGAIFALGILAAPSAVLAQGTPDPVSPPTADTAADARNAGAIYLRHLYAVYLAIRACTEASLEHGEPERLPTLSLADARRSIRVAENAARDAGLDVDRIWREVAPVGVITGEALKENSARDIARCGQLGGVFRIDLGNLQNALTKLGSQRSVIEKDF